MVAASVFTAASGHCNRIMLTDAGRKSSTGAYGIVFLFWQMLVLMCLWRQKWMISPAEEGYNKRNKGDAAESSGNPWLLFMYGIGRDEKDAKCDEKAEQLTSECEANAGLDKCGVLYSDGAFLPRPSI